MARDTLTLPFGEAVPLGSSQQVTAKSAAASNPPEKPDLIGGLDWAIGIVNMAWPEIPPDNDLRAALRLVAQELERLRAPLRLAAEEVERLRAALRLAAQELERLHEALEAEGYPEPRA